MSKKIQTMPDELKNLIKQGEGYTVEFKKSTASVSKDVYETVCSFSNREGGHIFLGVNDDGVVVGVQEDRVGAMKNDFITTVKSDKFYPTLFLQPVEYEIDGKVVIYVYVPLGKNVCSCDGRLYDRNNSTDLDITKNQYDVFQLYARKQQDVHYEDTVFPSYSVSNLRPDLIARARKMALIKNENHPWKDMTDEELLRSCNLIMEDPETHKEGITLAAILLFGPDSLIGAKLSHYMTDAIFRIYNVDRYDDREVVTTNLLDSYDRLMAFGERHLNDLFTLDGDVCVSSRNHILREIVSNLLIHRDFSNPYIAKLVIEKKCIRTENGNRFNGHGDLDLATFKPLPKNPNIAHVFREIGLADELGSGMRNTYKYTELYSGSKPRFIEGDTFETIIPLTEAATYIAGPTPSTRNGANMQSQFNNLSEKEKEILKIIGDNPYVKRDEIIDITGISRNSLDRALKKLKDENMLTRVGSLKDGHWKINVEKY